MRCVWLRVRSPLANTSALGHLCSLSGFPCARGCRQAGRQATPTNPFCARIQKSTGCRRDDNKIRATPPTLLSGGRPRRRRSQIKHKQPLTALTAFAATSLRLCSPPTVLFQRRLGRPPVFHTAKHSTGPQWRPLPEAIASAGAPRVTLTTWKEATVVPIHRHLCAPARHRRRTHCTRLERAQPANLAPRFCQGTRPAPRMATPAVEKASHPRWSQTQTARSDASRQWWQAPACGRSSRLQRDERDSLRLP